VLLSTSPPTARRNSSARDGCTLLVGYGVAAPFLKVQLADSAAFIPIVDTALLLTDTLTAALLLANSLRWHRRAPCSRSRAATCSRA